MRVSIGTRLAVIFTVAAGPTLIAFSFLVWGRPDPNPTMGATMAIALTAITAMAGARIWSLQPEGAEISFAEVIFGKRLGHFRGPDLSGSGRVALSAGASTLALALVLGGAWLVPVGLDRLEGAIKDQGAGRVRSRPAAADSSRSVAAPVSSEANAITALPHIGATVVRPHPQVHHQTTTDRVKGRLLVALPPRAEEVPPGPPTTPGEGTPDEQTPTGGGGGRGSSNSGGNGGGSGNNGGGGAPQGEDPGNGGKPGDNGNSGGGNDDGNGNGSGSEGGGAGGGSDDDGPGKSKNAPGHDDDPGNDDGNNGGGNDSGNNGNGKGGSEEGGDDHGKGAPQGKEQEQEEEGDDEDDNGKDKEKTGKD